MIPYNYHTHTARCGHAFGKDEEYVLEAIAHGVRILGFTDHIFYPNLYNENIPNIRGAYSELDNYRESILTLKEKYKDKIAIHLGFEAEYYEDYHDYYQNLLNEKIVDYLILGQHFNRENGVTHYYFGNSRDKKGLFKYRDSVIKAMRTGFYKLVCHPDLFMASYEKFDLTARKVSREICKEAARLGIPLEINLAGVRKGVRSIGKEKRYPYPYRDFWKYAGKYNCQVIIGVDAHQPGDFSNADFADAITFARDLKLNLIDKIDI